MTLVKELSMSLAIYEIYNEPEETSLGKFDPDFIFTPSQAFEVIRWASCTNCSYDFDQAGIVNLFGYAMTDTADAISAANTANEKRKSAVQDKMLMDDLKHNGNLLLELADYALRNNGKIASRPLGACGDNELLNSKLVKDIIISSDKLLADSWTAHRYNVKVFNELLDGLYELTDKTLLVRRDD